MQFITSLNYLDSPDFAARAHYIESPPLGQHSLGAALRVVAEILRGARRGIPLLLDSTSAPWFPELLASALIGLWPRRWRPVVVMVGDMWEPNPGLRGLIEKVIVRLANRAIHRYVVQSSEELEVFPRLWGIDPRKARLCLYFSTLTQHDLAAPPPPPGDFVFAGGNVHRDYAPLVAAARLLPERRFVIATQRLNGLDNLPPNVTASSVPHPEFVALLRAAAAVVVPVRAGLRRAAGHNTFLNAMLLGKPTIVPNVFGVADHIRDGETGLVVDGSPEDYVRALRWVFDPANREAVARMGQAASHTVSQQFTFERHVACLLRILDEAIRDAGGAT